MMMLLLFVVDVFGIFWANDDDIDEDYVEDDEQEWGRRWIEGKLIRC